jgi:hypothetical protein
VQKKPNWEVLRAKQFENARRVQNNLKAKVKNENVVQWDYVVLQSWRDVVADPLFGYGDYVGKFADIAHEQGTDVILYVSAWHALNEEPISGPEAYDTTTYELTAIKKIANRVNAKCVVPVGLGVAKMQKNGSESLYRYVHDFHPNQRTAYLTVNMFYAAFHKESSEGLQFNTVTETDTLYHKDDVLKENPLNPDSIPGAFTVEFGGEEKEQLQKAAYDAVFDFDSGLFLNREYEL